MFSAQLVEFYGAKHALVLMQDVTQRRAAQEELELMSERLLLATQSANLGVWDWDVERDALLWDEAMCTIYGLTVGAVANIAGWEDALASGRSRVCAASAARGAVGGRELRQRVSHHQARRRGATRQSLRPHSAQPG